MSAALVVAALLAFGVGVAHSVLGERYIVRRLLRRPDLPRLSGGDTFTRRTIRFAWHLTSIAWIGFGAVLLVLAEDTGLRVVTYPDGDAIRVLWFPATAATTLVARVIGITFLVSAVVTAAATRFRHLAWIVFLAIGVLALVA
jgi:hypothetical protein